MATDTAAQIAALTATIARQTAILDMGLAQTLENGRMVKVDLGTVETSRTANIAALTDLLGARPQVRRLLTIQHTKGL